MNDDKKPNSEQSASRQTVYNHDKQLDLIDVIVQLWAGKKTILAAIVVTLLLGMIYIFTVKQQWVSKAIVTLPAAGQVANYNAALNVLYAHNPQDKPVINELQHQLFNRFSASITALSGELKNRDEPLTLVVEQVNKDDKIPLRISFTAETAKEAQQRLVYYIQRINDEVVNDYGVDIYRSLSVKTRELTDLLNTQKRIALDKKQQRIDVIKQALIIADASNITSSNLSQAEYLSDDTLFLLGSASLKAMIAHEVTKPLVFDNAYYDTLRALVAMTNLKIQMENLQSFRYIAPEDLPYRRHSPKRVLIMILALILGGITGSGIVISRNISQQRKLK